jgi:hypothetical protein
MRKLKLITATCLLLTLAHPLSATAQADSVDEAFASVSEPFRTRLVERLRLMAEFERAEQWDELYDLLIKPRDESKEAFIERRQRDSINQETKWLIEFVPQKVDQEKPDRSRADYRVVGYAKVRERGCVVKRRGVVYAFLRDGEWYYSGFLVELTPSHTVAPPCLSEQS